MSSSDAIAGAPPEFKKGGMAHLPQSFAALLAAAHASRRPAIAVSGGADSMALALLTRTWCAPDGEPLALIVDHALRKTSAEEARLTSARLHAMGIPARILTLRHLAAGPGLAARAREARYAALFAAMADAGRVDLLLGHHIADQAETILMRRLSHSGPAGLSGMAPILETSGARLLRPLLHVAPGTLRAILRANAIGWIEDPSNRNPAALRSRLRTGLNDPNGNGPEIRELAAQAARAAAERAAMDRAAAAELATRAAIFPEGYAILAPGPLSVAALGALIRAITGAPYPPSTHALDRLAASPRPCVLGGVRFMHAGRLGPGWLLVREEAAMAPTIPGVPGALWDRRFRVIQNIGVAQSFGRAQGFEVTNGYGVTPAAGWALGLEQAKAGYKPEYGTEDSPDHALQGGCDHPSDCTTPDPPAMIGALGVDAAALRRHTHLPAAILRTVPALRVHGTLVAVPHLGYRASVGPYGGSVGVEVAFAPATPAAGAPFGS